jgi:hypothetical protein
MDAGSDDFLSAKPRTIWTGTWRTLIIWQLKAGIVELEEIARQQH